MDVFEDEPIEAELIVPGCYVSPSIHYISPKVDESEVSFYVNPLVKYKNLEANSKLL